MSYRLVLSFLLFLGLEFLPHCSAISQTVPESKSYAAYLTWPSLLFSPFPGIEVEYIPTGNVSSWFLSLSSAFAGYEDWRAKSLEGGYRRSFSHIAPAGWRYGIGITLCDIHNENIHFFLGFKLEGGYTRFISQYVCITLRPELYYFLGEQMLHKSYPSKTGILPRFPHNGIFMAFTLGLGFSD